MRQPLRLEPQMRRALLLAALLHLWLAVLVGTTPGGSAKPGEGGFGRLDIRLLGRPNLEGVDDASLPDLGPQGTATQRRFGGTVRPDAPQPVPDQPGAARQGRWQAQAGEAPAEQAAAVMPPLPLPAAAPRQDAPPPAAAQRAPAQLPPAPAVEPLRVASLAPLQPQPQPQPEMLAPAPRMEERALSRLPDATAALIRPSPLEPLRASPPAAPESLSAQALPSAPRPVLSTVAPVPAPLHSEALQALPTPAFSDLQRPAAAEALSPLSRMPAAAATASRARVEPLTPLRERERQALVPEDLRAAPPLEAPAHARANLPADAVRARSLPPEASLSRLEAERRVEAASPDRLPRMESPAAAPPAAPDGGSPAAEAATRSTAADAAPGRASAGRVDLSGASAGAPDAGAQLGHDIATPPSAPASAPLDLSLPSAARSGPVARSQGRSLLELMAPPAERKSKLQREMEEAAREDCRKAYGDKGSMQGLLALIPLAKDSVTGKGCRW